MWHIDYNINLGLFFSPIRTLNFLLMKLTLMEIEYGWLRIPNHGTPQKHDALLGAPSHRNLLEQWDHPLR